jgi:hypothetical protein
MGQMNPPAESPKTIDYHHLDMSRDDGMDEHGSDWIYACHLVDFLLEVCQITANFPHNPTTNLDRPYSLAVEFEPVQYSGRMNFTCSPTYTAFIGWVHLSGGKQHHFAGNLWGNTREQF